MNSPKRKFDLSTYYAGAVIFLTLLIGGGSRQDMWTDGLLQLAMLPVVFLGFKNLAENRLDKMGRILSILVVAVLLLQFLPIDLDRGFPRFDENSTALALWTSTPGKAFNSAVFGFCMLGIGLYVVSVDGWAQRFLVRFIFLGLAVNLLITCIQLSYDTNINIEGALPYTIRMGMFDNENHFASLTYLCIPLLAWRLLVSASQPFLYVLICLIIAFLQFAIGSRSGMLFTTSLGLVGAAWAYSLNWSWTKKALTAGSLSLAVLAGLVVVGPDTILEGDLRAIYLPQTLAIANQHWLTGTGLGSFLQVYPIYETRETVGRVYANHAHSDHLELYMELGIAYIAGLFLFLLLVARHAFVSPLTQAASLAIVAVLIHSMVDYPLRTMAIAVVFATLSGVVLGAGPKHDHASQMRN